MTLIQSIILGIVQGFAEFLPISSSGHLALFEKLFEIKNPLSYAIILHVGTFAATIYYFFPKLKKLTLAIIKDFKKKRLNKTLFLVLIATLPVVLAGVLLKDLIAAAYSNLTIVSISFFITSTLLFLAASPRKLRKNFDQIEDRDSLIIGVFQALAILPGVSRSGSTIAASFFQGIKKETAFYFSFLISIPAVFGALILDISDLSSFSSFTFSEIIIGLLTSFFSGLFAIKLFKEIILKDKLQYFAIYTFVIGVITLLLNQ